MQALVLTEKNKPIVVREKPIPSSDPSSAIVQIRAAALNHRDLWIQLGQYAGLKYPITPGSDGSGVVLEGPWAGKEVIINPSFNWGDKPTHQDQKHFKILGLPDDGTLAEYVKVPTSALAEKPPHLSFEEAAALPLAGLTAYRALFTRAAVKTGDKLLVTGIGGGVALFALQFAVAAGAEVYVTSGSDDKIARAVEMGAKAGANYKTEGWSTTLLEKHGPFDVIIDGAAGDSMDDLLNLAAPGGRLAFYGATRGNPSNITARRIFWKQLTIVGSTMGSPEDFLAMTAFVVRHGIVPVVDKIFPFAEAEAALRHMESAQQFGKIVITI